MNSYFHFFCTSFDVNKPAKARKTRKSPGTLDLKRFGPGKLWVKNFRKAYPNPNLKKIGSPFFNFSRREQKLEDA